MPVRGDHGSTGYTFDPVELSTKSHVSKVFELRSKAGGVNLGTVRWSSPDRAYIYCPEANVMRLTHADLVALGSFLSRQNSKEGARKLALQT